MKSPRWTRSQYLEFCKRTGTVPQPKVPPKNLRRGKTKTEEDFEAWFKFRHPSCRLLYEPFKLKIDQSCWYLPDFFCPELMVVLEVKGPHIFEDSVIKWKAARTIHSWVKFEMWQRRDGVWRQIRKLPNGVMD